MSEFFANFHFLRPWLLLLLIFPFGFFGYALAGGVRGSGWEKVCDSELLSYLLIKNKNGGRRFARFLFLLGLTAGIIASAGPAWKEKIKPSLAVQNPLMILLNMSSDMQYNDISPSRLERAKIEIAELLGQIPDVESGLIVYSDEPFMISPLSKDPALIINLLGAVNPDIMPVNGDRTDRAIDLAVERIRAAGFNSGNIVIFAAEGGVDEALALEATEKAAAKNIKVSAMAMSESGSTALLKMTQAGEGRYEKISAMSASEIASFIKSTLSNTPGESKNTASDWEDSGYYLMFVSILCFLLMFRKGILGIVLVFATFSNVSAGWWFSDSYEAQNLFDNGNFAEAAAKFEDPAWQGAARYRNGDYEAAAESFAKVEGVEGAYNHANALAKSGKIEEAIAEYEAVLEQQPDHEDAKFNLEYLKQQQDQQQQQNQNQQQNQDQNQEQSNPQNQSGGGDNGDNNEEQQPEDQEADSQPSEGQDRQDDHQDKQSPENVQEQNQPAGKEQDEAEKQDQNMATAGQEKEESDQQYDEEIQAREQRFRDIPEDTGGLLRAFIRKEYNKNRYGE